MYYLINFLLTAAGGENAVVLGVEPLGFGLIATAADTLCIGVKRTMMNIIAEAKKGIH